MIAISQYLNSLYYGPGQWLLLCLAALCIYGLFCAFLLWCLGAAGKRADESRDNTRNGSEDGGALLEFIAIVLFVIIATLFVLAVTGQVDEVVRSAGL